MNNKQLNKEFTQMLKDRKFQGKSGFTDSEDEDEKSLKSPKSARSSISARSSLLSSRSPREEKLNYQRGNLSQIKSKEQRKFSPDKSGSDNEFNPTRRLNRFSTERSMSPKSPKSIDELYSRNNRLAKNRSQSREEDNEDRSFTNNQAITPRSLNSARSDDSRNFEMMKTIRKPLNEGTGNRLKKNEDYNHDEFHMQKQRAATPTKLNFGQRFQTGLNAKTNFNQRRVKLEDDLEEELSVSGKTTPSKSESRRLSKNEQIEENSPSISRSNSFKNRTNSESPRPNRSFSPRDSMDVNHKNDPKQAYEKHINALNHLINPKSKKSDSMESVKKESDFSKKEKVYTNSEKDPEVVETVEDKKISEKLQKEREQKRILRENRTKNLTETSKKVEEAIEEVENTMEDSLRLKNLKEITNELKYSTKPTLEEMLKNERLSRSRNTNQKERSNSRARSLSSSSRLEKTFNNKYSNVKPKTQTRLQSARNANDTNQHDVMNDSSSIRQNIYSEWYQKKLFEAQQQLKEAKLKQKDQEEKNAQELIDKLQKSKLIFKIWSEKKGEMLKVKRKILNETSKKELEKELEKKDKKKEAEIAFREWLKKKLEYEKEKKEEQLETRRMNEKKERKEKEIETKKPPLPYESWAKKKEEDVKEKQKIKQEKEREKQMEEFEKKKKKDLAKLAYYEWLDKKDQDDLNKSKSLSTSMSSLPPFYPTSKIIPYKNK